MGCAGCIQCNRVPVTNCRCLLSPREPTDAHPPSSGIQFLPVEILIDIFTLCSRDAILAPLALASVCRFWNTTIATSPPIWNHIFVSDWIPSGDQTQSISFSRALSEIWLVRSSPLPFDVEVDVGDRDMLLPLLVPFIPHVQRWRRLTVNGPGSHDETLDIAGFSPISVPRLQITLRDTSELSTRYESTFVEHALGLSLNVPMMTLPPAVRLAPQHYSFTRLHISERTFDYHPTPRDLLSFLAVCPSLEHFAFDGGLQDVGELPVRQGSTLPVPVLTHLHSLRIYATCAARTLLSHIYAPTLSHLVLEFLNVEVDPPDALHGDDLLYEDGDSDDEAHDFSQSPYTDHATGMGLRNFIKRSRPPLQVLEMDYSDMRTKDFRWCFDRLVQLTKFRIIASDMSDSVIQLLKPETVSAVPGNGHAAGSGISASDAAVGEDVTRVRLPRLRDLYLYNCQQLSGDAIVDAIGARTRYAKVLADSPTGKLPYPGAQANQQPTLEQLEDVIISGCDGFTERHAHLLSRDLRGRLQMP
ncbi:hypothetical protein PLICRDRAFT_39465 [Plicaturopsis crispa FD-325 SS-3]|nr:hypothetical protein PLICRDRAFT_39465 [Plicaturopsis crispa FD-325 SS-3]